MSITVRDAPQTREDAVERARSLFPLIRSHARQADDMRSLPQEVVDTFMESGLVRLLVPRRWGGTELGLLAQFEAAVELGRAGGAMGWVGSFLMDHPFFVAHMDERAQSDVWEGPDGPDAPIATSFVPVGQVSPADGGWLLTGDWAWASGVQFCRWILLGGMVAGDDGAPPQYRLFLVPTSDVEVIDTWYSAGLRGSGSNTVQVRNAYVPDYRTLIMAGMREGQAPGAGIHDNPIYHAPQMAHGGSAMVAPAVGIARGVVDAWREMVQVKAHSYSREQVAAGAPMQLCLAEAATRIDCADMLVRRALELVESGVPITLEDRVRNRRDITYATRLLTAAMNDLIGTAGASALLDDSPIQRGWRDVRAIACHVFCNFNAAGENYGRMAFGFPLNPRDPFF